MRVNAKTTRSGKTTKKATTRTRKGAPRKRRNSGAKGDLRQQAVRVNKLEACMVSMAEMLKSRAQPLDFVIPTVVRGTVTALVGPGGVGKSGFALQTAISVAIGRDAYNLWGDSDAPVAIKKGNARALTLGDMAKIATLFQNKGRHGTNQILSAPMLETMLAGPADRGLPTPWK